MELVLDVTQARKRKKKIYPELTGPRARARLGGWRQVVSGDEVVCGSAPRTVRATSLVVQDGTGVETEVVLFSCAAVRLFAMSLFGLKGQLVLMATHQCRMRCGLGLN